MAGSVRIPGRIPHRPAPQASSILNELFAAALLSCPIHPVYIRELAHKMQTRIDSTENHEALCALPGKILRQYCFWQKRNLTAAVLL